MVLDSFFLSRTDAVYSLPKTYIQVYIRISLTKQQTPDLQKAKALLNTLSGKLRAHKFQRVTLPRKV